MVSISEVEVIKLFLMGLEINLFRILKEINLLILDKLKTKTDNTETHYAKSLLEICFNSQRALQASKTIDSVALCTYL